MTPTPPRGLWRTGLKTSPRSADRRAVTPTSVDDDVIEGVRSARPDALEAAYRAYAGPLLGWVRSQGTEGCAAEEVVEETFLELVRDCRSITGGSTSLRAWLYQVTRRNLTDHHRARQRDRSIPSEALPDHPSPDPSTADVVNRLDGPVEAALQALSPGQREVVALRYLADLTMAEIATVTGRSPVGGRQLLHTGRRAMAARLRRTTMEVRR